MRWISGAYEFATGQSVEMKNRTFATPAGSEFVKLCERLTGQTAGTVAFGTEGPYLQALGMETVVLGPGSIDQAHQPDEYLQLSRLQPTIDVLQGLIAACCVA